MYIACQHLCVCRCVHVHAHTCTYVDAHARVCALNENPKIYEVFCFLLKKHTYTQSVGIGVGGGGGGRGQIYMSSYDNNHLFKMMGRPSARSRVDSNTSLEVHTRDTDNNMKQFSVTSCCHSPS